MFIYKYNKRPLIENSQSISASIFVRNYYLDFKQKMLNKANVDLDLNREESVKYLIEMMESGSTINLRQEANGKVEFTEQNKIHLTYTKSNLGKGFVFWFICGVCGKRVRYLYIPPYCEVSACRKCHRLTYGQRNDNKRFRSLNRFF